MSATDRLGKIFPFVEISGVVPLPTGAATSANQATEITLLGEINSKTPALGYAVKITEVGAVTYVGKAAAGSAQAAAVWQCQKIDETTGMVITWADGDILYDNAATDLTLLAYS